MFTPTASSPKSSRKSAAPVPPYSAGEFEPHLGQSDRTVRRLQLMQLCGGPGASYSAREISEFCGISRQRVELLEKQAILKLGRALLERFPGLFSEIRGGPLGSPSS